MDRELREVAQQVEADRVGVQVTDDQDNRLGASQRREQPHHRKQELEMIFSRILSWRRDLAAGCKRWHESSKRRIALRQLFSLSLRTTRRVSLQCDREWAVREMIAPRCRPAPEHSSTTPVRLACKFLE